MVPDNRVRASDAPVRADGRYVLYGMTAQRRTTWNHGLDHALRRARELGRPLVVFEALRVAYPYASVRHHVFALQGMVDNRTACAAAGVRYLPWVEPRAGEGKGLLAALAADAALVVVDDAPLLFLPRALDAAMRTLPVRVEAVDGCGMLPLAEHGQAFAFAHAFRRHLQRTLPPHLATRPRANGLAGYDLGLAELPAAVARWPAADLDALLSGGIGRLPIDQAVGPVDARGGQVEARRVLARFLAERVSRYGAERNQPDAEVASGLSPWLHWGHIGAHEVVWAVLDAEGWTADRLALKPNGSREGWWHASPGAESFLDELITWRELGWGAARHDPTFGTWEGLPVWARTTLTEAAADPRVHVYDRTRLEEARTYDPVWNAAQRELRATGRIHNYLRMLWGKKVLEWSASPEEAFTTLLALNDRWAIDGRDPNSNSGISWTFGRFDRPWAPKRPIFGTIRYMSSDNTRKKLDLRTYLQRWAPERGPATGLLPFPENT